MTIISLLKILLLNFSYMCVFYLGCLYTNDITLFKENINMMYEILCFFYNIITIIINKIYTLNNFI